MATISRQKGPRALARTGRWAEPGSKSAALFARAQGFLPGGNSRTTVYMAPYLPYAAAGEGCWITDVEGDRRLDCLNNYLLRLVRRLMEHGVLVSVTGLGCLSTPMGDAELESLVETFAAVLDMERGA